MSGTLEALALHPVKSTAIRPVRRAAVEAWGLRDDRHWMVVDAAGECLTAREHHAMFALTADTPDTDPSVSNALRLTASGHDPLLVDEPRGDAHPVTVHARPLSGRDAGPEAAAWLRSALGHDDVRLVHVAEPRALNPAHARPGEATAFADGYPVTLASAASLRRLQDWVTETALERGEEPVEIPMARFRPNLVVDGDLEPFAEDHWRTVTVGAVTFRVVKPVDRCVMTTIDPATLAGGHEPIRTLARHRRWDGSTWFAVQLVPEVTGEVRLGDEVRPAR